MNRKILVIEDNNDIRENVVEILELAGYRVVSASNGKQGIALALQETPEVIICDIMMPELDGYAVLHMVRRNPAMEAVPFIFLTAKTERGDFRKGMEMGADDYLTKPFDDGELLAAVDARLKKAKLLGNKYPSTPSGLTQFIKDVKSLSREEVLATDYEIITADKKTVLFQEGRKPRFLYYLLSGKVKCSKDHEEGKEYITDFYSAGDFMGYAPLIEDAMYGETAVVMEQAEVVQVPREEFIKMINSDINIASRFIKIITKNEQQKEERMLNLAYSSLRKRIAKSLVDIVSKFELNDPGKPIEISREEIAQYVGTATESLNRTIADFKAEGLIDIHKGKILPVNMKKIKEMPY